jgi:hypothetical protein
MSEICLYWLLFQDVARSVVNLKKIANLKRKTSHLSEWDQLVNLKKYCDRNFPFIRSMIPRESGVTVPPPHVFSISEKAVSILCFLQKFGHTIIIFSVYYIFEIELAKMINMDTGQLKNVWAHIDTKVGRTAFWITISKTKSNRFFMIKTTRNNISFYTQNFLF